MVCKRFGGSSIYFLNRMTTLQISEKTSQIYRKLWLCVFFQQGELTLYQICIIYQVARSLHLRGA